jgi:hypothetical protein
MFGGWSRGTEEIPGGDGNKGVSDASVVARGGPLRASVANVRALERDPQFRITTLDAPPILAQLVRYLLTKGSSVEKIFLVVPPHGTEFETLRNKLNSERDALLLSSHTKNPHIVAELLKYYLSCLPEPLISFDMYDRSVYSFSGTI